MRHTFAVALGLALLSVAGCSSIRREYDDRASFAYDTWNWMRLETEGVDRVVDRRIRRRVTATMAAKGLRQTTKDPRLLVTYHAGDGRPIDPSPLEYRYGGWGKVSRRTYPLDSIVLDCVDAASRELVWRGSAQHVLDESLSGEKLDRSIDEAVEKLLEKFPPR